jgi:hypothetical protein
MRTLLALLPALFAIACTAEAQVAAGPQAPGPIDPAARAPRPREPIVAAPMEGPFGSVDAACGAIVKWAEQTLAWKNVACDRAEIPIAGAPLAGLVLRAYERSPSDARAGGSGAFFFGIRAGSATFYERDPFAQINGGAGHLFLPKIEATRGEPISHGSEPPRVRAEIRVATEQVCTSCDGPARDERKLAMREKLTFVCEAEGAKVVCAAPKRETTP